MGIAGAGCSADNAFNVPTAHVDNKPKMRECVCAIHVGSIYDRWNVCLQVDDPLDAIAVHAFNGTWGVIAVGLFAADNLVRQSYGFHPYLTDGAGESTIPRNYGCFMGGNGRLLAAQIVYAIWLGGVPSTTLLLCLS